MAMSKFLTEIQWFAQSLVSERIIFYVEAISIDTVKNAVATFIQMKLLTNVNYEFEGVMTASVKIAVD